MAQQLKASCEENNAAMLSPINLTFLLKDSSSILVERVSQSHKGIYFRGSYLFPAFNCFYFSTSFECQAESHGYSTKK